MAGLFSSIFGKPVKESYLDPVSNEYRIVTTDNTLHAIPAEALQANMINSRLPPIAPPWVNTPYKNANPTNPLDDESYRIRLIRMRLRIPEGSLLPYQFLATHFAGEEVIVFVVQDGQPVTLRDEAPLFPSDQLITQLRLLEK